MAKLTVLVCPMDWGLGHASRCVPVIRAFLDAGCRVVVAAEGGGRKLIEREFSISSAAPVGQMLRPEVTGFPGFRVSWHGRFPLLRFMVRLPSFLLHIGRERNELSRLVSLYGARIVVSDNRYGVVHPSVYSVIITHQLRPSLPSLMKVFEGSVAWMVRRMVGRFDECWIPDCPGGPVAGKLVRGWERLQAAFFVGLLSRFRVADGYRSPASGKYRILFVLSGPEPGRTLFERKVRDMMRSSGIRALLVQGLPDAADKRRFPATDTAGSTYERQRCLETAAQGAAAGLKGVQQDLAKGDMCFGETEADGDLHVVPFLDSGGLLEAMEMSGLVVCRSGYSTVCDLLVAGREAVMVPTPGQTEQEYLGRWLSAKGYFRVISQDELAQERLPEILKKAEAGKVSMTGKAEGTGMASMTGKAEGTGMASMTGKAERTGKADITDQVDHAAYDGISHEDTKARAEITVEGAATAQGDGLHRSVGCCGLLSRSCIDGTLLRERVAEVMRRVAPLEIEHQEKRDG